MVSAGQPGHRKDEHRAACAADVRTGEPLAMINESAITRGKKEDMYKNGLGEGNDWNRQEEGQRTGQIMRKRREGTGEMYRERK